MSGSGRRRRSLWQTISSESWMAISDFHDTSSVQNGSRLDRSSWVNVTLEACGGGIWVKFVDFDDSSEFIVVVMPIEILGCSAGLGYAVKRADSTDPS